MHPPPWQADRKLVRSRVCNEGWRIRAHRVRLEDGEVLSSEGEPMLEADSVPATLGYICVSR